MLLEFWCNTPWLNSVDATAWLFCFKLSLSTRLSTKSKILTKLPIAHTFLRRHPVHVTLQWNGIQHWPCRELVPMSYPLQPSCYPLPHLHRHCRGSNSKIKFSKQKDRHQESKMMALVKSLIFNTSPCATVREIHHLRLPPMKLKVLWSLNYLITFF